VALVNSCVPTNVETRVTESKSDSITTDLRYSIIPNLDYLSSLLELLAGQQNFIERQNVSAT
jgi:hypothetical protein